MNKSELIESIASESGLSKADSLKALDAMLGSVTQALQNGEQVVLVGFGTFSVKDRAPRRVRNPRTGDVIEVAASRVASFKPGKGLKQAVAGEVAAEASA